MVNNSLRKSETPISSGEKTKTPGILNACIGAFLVADSDRAAAAGGIKPVSSGSDEQGPRGGINMPG